MWSWDEIEENDENDHLQKTSKRLDWTEGISYLWGMPIMVHPGVTQNELYIST